ncbi:phosphatidate cytidylyltransferase [Nitratireductor basaltis]|uniref:Phosphatidate cytidylyltransferase n=1 Tax=Nitratireductor basaltis TaxID=472175 RepID=A0A084UB51_9HYPH|nr:phosphatidate cytidylyltransferase [Nitratireductor basaltis]KFB10187.1 Phosphatidate cytidylyltransferase [Nitratireductor basaltis]
MTSEPAAQPMAKPKSDLRVRALSALVMAVIVLFATFLGGVTYRLFAVLLALLVYYEWTGMKPTLPRDNRLIGWGALVASLAPLVIGLPDWVVVIGIALASLLVGLHAMGSNVRFWNAYGVAYAALPALAIATLRNDTMDGLIIVLYLYAVVWATDIVAYFVGRAIGGPKLAPSISPGKTWSGAVGGTVGAAVAGVALIQVMGISGSALIFAAILAVALSIMSQAGDLFESALKRRTGVKDSGRLIPGHGGVMDRVDGLIAAALLLYAALALAGFAGTLPDGLLGQ